MQMEKILETGLNNVTDPFFPQEFVKYNLK